MPPATEARSPSSASASRCPESFVFSPDGRYLYGSSYYTGVSNIFRYEVATGEIEAVTNTDTDFFRPFPLRTAACVVLAYTATGFVPAIIEPVVVKDASAIRFLGTELASKHPVVTTVAGGAAERRRRREAGAAAAAPTIRSGT